MLSDLTVRQATATGKPYTLADTDGLSLFVSATGAKAWHFRFSWGGKRDRMSFGPYPALSLKDARALRDEARSLLAKGVNPQVIPPLLAIGRSRNAMRPWSAAVLG